MWNSCECHSSVAHSHVPLGSFVCNSFVTTPPGAIWQLFLLALNVLFQVKKHQPWIDQTQANSCQAIWPGEDVGRRSRDIQRQCSQKRSFLIEGPGIQKRQRHLSFRWPQPLPTLENVSQNFKGWSCCLCRYCGCTRVWPSLIFIHILVCRNQPVWITEIW